MLSEGFAVPRQTFFLIVLENVNTLPHFARVHICYNMHDNLKGK